MKRHAFLSIFLVFIFTTVFAQYNQGQYAEQEVFSRLIDRPRDVAVGFNQEKWKKSDLIKDFANNIIKQGPYKQNVEIKKLEVYINPKNSKISYVRTVYCFSDNFGREIYCSKPTLLSIKDPNNFSKSLEEALKFFFVNRQVLSQIDFNYKPPAGSFTRRRDQTKSIEQNLINSTVYIQSRTTDGGYASGSGTNLGCIKVSVGSYHCYILTAFHVISDTNKISVEVNKNGVISGRYLAKIILSPLTGREADLALLEIETSSPLFSRSILSSIESIDPGEKVFSVGCLLGKRPPSLLTGRGSCKVEEVGYYFDRHEIDCSLSAQSGQSGGGLFNSDGKLIGVCVGTHSYHSWKEINNFIGNSNYKFLLKN